MPAFNPDTISADVATADIWALRGRAIDAYSGLEQSLGQLFILLTGMKPDVAAVVFFKIASKPTRNAMFDKLIRKRHGSKYSLFWNSYLKQLRPIDTKRDEIVHWATLIKAEATPMEGNLREIVLIPPNIWDFSEESPSIDANVLNAFIDTCRDYSRLCSMFCIVTAGRADPELEDTWRDIFQQPITYPPPEDHPLYKTWPKPHSQPRPSPA